MQTRGGANKPALLIGLFYSRPAPLGKWQAGLSEQLQHVSGTPVPGTKVGVMLQGGKIAVLTSATNEDGLSPFQAFARTFTT